MRITSLSSVGLVFFFSPPLLICYSLLICTTYVSFRATVACEAPAKLDALAKYQSYFAALTCWELKLPGPREKWKSNLAASVATSGTYTSSTQTKKSQWRFLRALPPPNPP